MYKAEYHWSVECTDTTFTKDYNVVYDADKSNPYIGIRLPDDFRGRMAKINFSVQYSYSATAPQSAPSGSNSGQSVFTVVLRLRQPVSFMGRGVVHILFLGNSLWRGFDFR